MTIWILAVLLLASLAGLGYRQGAIRVACSLIGIILGALLAVPLGGVFRLPLKAFGLQQPILLWVIPPFIMFIVFSVAAKIGGLALHQKVDVYYKYKAGDLRLALWERLNQRVGLCVGLINGTLYLILICWVIYAFSYWTYQMASASTDPKAAGDPMPVRMLNRMGDDLRTSGFAKVAASVDGMKPSFYESADVAGLLYNNSLLEARLSRYPGFLGLAERQEFQNLGNDKSFSEMRLQRKPFMEVMNHPAATPITQNPQMLRTIWSNTVPDLKDLTTFLETAKSPKYDPEKILGRWTFNINMTMAMYRRAKPTISSNEMLKRKRWMIAEFSKTTFVATTEHSAFLKQVPPLKQFAAAGSGPQNMQGTWQSLDGGKYQLTLTGSGDNVDLPSSVDGDRLTVKVPGMDLVFDRED